MENEKLIYKAKKYISLLHDLSGELDYSKYRLESNLEKYLSNLDIKSKVDLLSSIAFFEKYFFSLIHELKSKEYSIIQEEIRYDEFKLIIDRDWRAYEFKQLFNGVDYFHKIYSLESKLLRNIAPSKSYRTKDFYYRYALLHYYMSIREELSVTKIRYASLGDIKFKGVGDAIRATKEVVDWIITGEWIKKIINNFDIVKDKRRRAIIKEIEIKKDQLELEQINNRILEERLNRLKTEQEIEHFSLLGEAILITRKEMERDGHSPESYEKFLRGIQKFEEINRIGIQLEHKKIASLIQFEQQVIINMRNLNRMGVDNNKVRPCFDSERHNG